MDKLVGQFWKLVVSLAGIAGLYLGALAVNLVWVFWIVVGGSAVLVGFLPVLRGAAEIYTRSRNYPKLLRIVAELKELQSVQLKRIQDLENSGKKKWEEGVLDGRYQAIGVVLPVLSEIPIPAIAGVATHDDAVSLVAKVDPDMAPKYLNSRYNVVSALTGDIKGIVQITETNETNGVLTMPCVEAMIPGFWNRLAERAMYDGTPPSDLSLALIQLPDGWLDRGPTLYRIPSSDLTTGEDGQ